MSPSPKVDQLRGDVAAQVSVANNPAVRLRQVLCTISQGAPRLRGDVS